MKYPLPTILVLLILAGCASDAPISANAGPEPTPDEIARALGCTRSEIAFCVDSDCGPEEYRCVDRRSMLESMSPGWERN